MAPKRRRRQSKQDPVSSNLDGLATKVFYNPRNKAGFGGLDGVRKAIVEDCDVDSVHNGVDVEAQVKKWSLKQEPYTLHKPVVKKFRRVRIRTTFIDELWQADLCDMQDLHEHNDSYKYLLNVIDCFSKKAWSKPLKRKTADETCAAFKQIVEESGRKPLKLNTDKGKEFLNSKFQKWLQENNIVFFTANNPDIKAAIVERFNKTIKTRLWKYFSWKQTFRYLDVLDDFVASYNSRVHSSTGLAPDNVNISNMHSAYLKMFGKQIPKKIKYQFQVRRHSIYTH
jgi:transposase InsO family protein